MATLINGSCAWPGAEHIADFAHESPIQVEDAHIYDLSVDYTVETAVASSQTAMLHDFFLQLGFYNGNQYLYIDGVVYRDLRARCLTDPGAECVAGDDFSPGPHHVQFQATAHCQGAVTCAVPFHAYAFTWSFPRDDYLNQQQANGSAELALQIDNISLTPTGLIAPSIVSGIVFDDTGARLEGVCVGLQGEGSPPDEFRYFTQTQQDGTYQVEVDPGEYLAWFADCSHLPQRWKAEWYPDSPAQESATPITVDRGQTVTASVMLQRNFSPDIGIDSLKVKADRLRTDMGPAPVQPGTQRVIDITIANSGSQHWPVDVVIVACPRKSNDCRTIVADGLELEAASTLRRLYNWDATGWVGDVTVSASVIPRELPDPRTANNQASVNTYVVIGGVGIGVVV